MGWENMAFVFLNRYLLLYIPSIGIFQLFIIICLRFVPDIFSRQSFAEFFGGDLYFFFFEDDFTVGVGTQNQFVGVFTELAHCG